MKGLQAGSVRPILRRSVTKKLLRPALALAVTAFCSAFFSASSSFANESFAFPQHLTTLLKGSEKHIDGPLPVASTDSIKSMASDSQDTLYFSDTSSHAIRVITNEGIVRTLSHERLRNVDFMAVDSDDQLYFLQIYNFLRDDPYWEIKRLHDNGDTELISRGDGRVYAMEYDHHDGFVLHHNHSYYHSFDNVDYHHEFVRVSRSGQKEVIYDSLAAGPESTLTNVRGVTTDKDGSVLVLDERGLRRIQGNGVLKDVAVIQPQATMGIRDITVTPENHLLVCSRDWAYTWRFSGDQVQVLNVVNIQPLPEEMPNITDCQVDAKGNINVIHNNMTYHAISRVHTPQRHLVYPGVYNPSAFSGLLQSFAAGKSSIDISNVIHVSIGPFNYQLIADTPNMTNLSNKVTGIYETEDSNGDGLSEFLVVYPDETEQLLYLLPPGSL